MEQITEKRLLKKMLRLKIISNQRNNMIKSMENLNLQSNYLTNIDDEFEKDLFERTISESTKFKVNQD